MRGGDVDQLFLVLYLQLLMSTFGVICGNSRNRKLFPRMFPNQMGLEFQSRIRGDGSDDFFAFVQAIGRRVC